MTRLKVALFALVLLVAAFLLVRPAHSFVPELTSSHPDSWSLNSFPIQWSINPSAGSNNRKKNAVTRAASD